MSREGREFYDREGMLAKKAHKNFTEKLGKWNTITEKFGSQYPCLTGNLGDPEVLGDEEGELVD